MTDGTEKDDDDGRIVTENPEYEVTRWTPEDKDGAIVTGFKASKTADDLAREADDEVIEAGEKAALARATAKLDDKSDGKEKIDTGMKPGLKLAGEETPAAAAPLPDLEPNFSTKGRGWIKVKDTQGKTHKVRDDGNSIYIPGTPTGIQMQLVAQLAQEKGWTRVMVFDRGGSKLHPLGTKMMTQLMGDVCCSNPKEAGKLNHHLANADETFLNTLKARHAAAHPKAPAPAAP
jgi:hypothetical protein